MFKSIIKFLKLYILQKLVFTLLKKSFLYKHSKKKKVFYFNNWLHLQVKLRKKTYFKNLKI